MTTDSALSKNEGNSKYTVLSSGQNRVLNLFFTVTLIGLISAMLGIILYYVYAFAALAGGSSSFDWLLGIFSDFVTIMDSSLSNSPYELDGVSYPPLAIAILYPFALICKSVFAQYSELGLTVDQLTAKVILHPQFWVALVLFFTVCTAVIVFVIIKAYRLDLKASLKVGAIIIFSSPFVFAIMRGNTIYFALVFLLLFLLLYNSEKAWVREISYICLVLAGLIKIYPLFFGVYVLNKKRIFAAARIAVYFAAGAFASFFIYNSGFDSFPTFVHNLGSFANDSYHLLSTRNLSLTSIFFKISNLISPNGTEFAIFSAINISALVFCFVVASVCATVTKSEFSRAAIASAIIVLVPSVSYFYILVFEIIPFMEFIKHYDEFEKNKRRLYTGLFLFMFFTIALLPQNFILHSLAVIVMFAVEARNVIKNEIIVFFKRKKA